MTFRSQLFRHEPAWFDGRSSRRALIPAPLRGWLYEPGSLTLRLQRACGPAFRVAVLSQAWGLPFPSERRLLGLPANQPCLLREVALLRSQEPLVLARSIIPAATLRRADPGLGSLGSRPLGEVLFACPRLRREQLQLACIKPWQLLAAPPTAVWSRRSHYAIAAGDLLVCELFLPTVLNLPEPGHD